MVERYPRNGRLLYCYGRFLEDVANDPRAAQRAYNAAVRQVRLAGLTHTFCMSEPIMPFTPETLISWTLQLSLLGCTLLRRQSANPALHIAVDVLVLRGSLSVQSGSSL